MWKKNFVEDTDIPVMPLEFFSIMMFISADWAVLEFRESLTFGSGLIRPPGAGAGIESPAAAAAAAAGLFRALSELQKRNFVEEIVSYTWLVSLIRLRRRMALISLVNIGRRLRLPPSAFTGRHAGRR